MAEEIDFEHRTFDCNFEICQSSRSRDRKLKVDEHDFRISSVRAIIVVSGNIDISSLAPCSKEQDPSELGVISYEYQSSRSSDSSLGRKFENPAREILDIVP